MSRRRAGDFSGPFRFVSRASRPSRSPRDARVHFEQRATEVNERVAWAGFKKLSHINCEFVQFTFAAANRTAHVGDPRAANMGRPAIGAFETACVSCSERVRPLSIAAHATRAFRRMLKSFCCRNSNGCDRSCRHRSKFMSPTFLTRSTAS